MCMKFLVPEIEKESTGVVRSVMSMEVLWGQGIGSGNVDWEVHHTCAVVVRAGCLSQSVAADLCDCNW